MQSLNELLTKIDPIEEQQLVTGKNVNDLSKQILKPLKHNSTRQIAMPRTFFNGNQDVVVRKHHRFSTMRKHTHDFVELNYIYSGNCTQYIDGKPVNLPAGSLIMLDKNITQSIDYMGENDILINILLRDGNSLNAVLENISSSQNIVTKFMYNASKIESIHDNFIIFNLNQNEYAKKLIECLILKGLSNDLAKSSALRSLYALLVPELATCIEQETINFDQSEPDSLLPVLKYIEDHYRTVTLATLAQHFGYNPNYLGNKLREQTGQPFHEIVDDKKFSVATALLKETDDSIEKIATYLGYHVPTSLYHLFKRKTGETPRAYRMKYGH